ncbi:PEP-CTERM sorting domain-containing protein [Novosphingobium umbonatum]|uniref:PEP-CTERM sorting domain-containing protein n=1 Tax=Novosphingobium umbonatum TaxID=1908524 RepID=A0A3S2URE5_9SPHN|nr:PEPxxWA-CTERM sorting domain-containing protein [Novosphingobium umbonatum]RVU04323.1 PEP-CTERM sorting domain-containing protein [Novosphingobium umbonatum]
MNLGKKALLGALAAATVAAAPSAANAASIVQTGSTYTVSGTAVSETPTFTYVAPYAGTLTIKLFSSITGADTNVNFATNGVRLYNGATATGAYTYLNVLSSGATELQSLVLAVAAGDTFTLATKYSSASLGSFTLSFAVPEPATWALMILGFGAVAYAMRRRNAGALVAA